MATPIPFDVLIRDLGVHGEGIGRAESGMTVFVPGALPGEQVAVVPDVVKAHYTRASLTSITVPSPSRVVPFCEYFGTCGGCQLQHLDYTAQLKWKLDHITSAFTRIAGLSPVIRPVTQSPSHVGYRNKAQFPVRMDTNGHCQLGFYAPQTHSLVPISHCAIQHLLIDTVYKRIQEGLIKFNIRPYNEVTHDGDLRHVLLRYSHTQQLVWVVFVLNATKATVLNDLAAWLVLEPGTGGVLANFNREKRNAILGRETVLLHGDGLFTEELDHVKFQFSPVSFSQVNWPQTAHLYRTVSELAGLSPEQSIWDLYCGAGTIGLYLANQVSSVLGVESMASAIDQAQHNARLNDVSHAKFASFNLDHGIPDSVCIGKPDVVIVDPPRKGCSDTVLTDLIRVASPKIVYVSCDPATMARDAKILCQSGYKLDVIVPLDMFPHTTHVECVGLFTLS